MLHEVKSRDASHVTEPLYFDLFIWHPKSPDIQIRRRWTLGEMILFLLSYWVFVSFLPRSFPSCTLVGWMVEQEFARADMMFPHSGHGLARLLTVIYFSLPVACSLPRRGCVE